MKNAFIRMMAVAVFTTSLSAFAQSDGAKAAKHDNPDGAKVGTAVESNVSVTPDELLGKVDQLQEEVQQLKENQAEQRARQEDTTKEIRQQEKEWEHSLMGIYGG
jgi:TolA-binding protein